MNWAVVTFPEANSASDQKRSKRRDTLAIAGFVLAVTAQVAMAGPVEDCRGGPTLNMNACTEVISSPSFGPDEKSLAYRYRGAARIDGGENKPAITDFTESIRLKKDNMFAFAGRGRAKFADGDVAGAVADYSEAISQLPKPIDPAVASDLYLQRGHVHIVGNQLDAAINDLTEAIRLNPSSAQALNTRGVAYVKKHDPGKAIDDYTAAIALTPIPQIYANRGYAYEAQGQSQQAIDDLQNALTHDPSLIGARDGLKRLGAPVDAITTQTNQRVRLGAALAEKNCSGCHAVGTTGVSPNKNATEFRNYYEKQPLFGLRAPITRAIRETHDKIQDESLKAMKTAMSDGEIDSIVAYINSLSTAKRLGSPE